MERHIFDETGALSPAAMAALLDASDTEIEIDPPDFFPMVEWSRTYIQGLSPGDIRIKSIAHLLLQYLGKKEIASLFEQWRNGFSGAQKKVFESNIEFAVNHERIHDLLGADEKMGNRFISLALKKIQQQKVSPSAVKTVERVRAEFLDLLPVDHIEADIVLFLLCLSQVPILEKVFGSQSKQPELIARVLGISVGDLMRRVSRKSTLMTLGIVDGSHNGIACEIESDWCWDLKMMRLSKDANGAVDSDPGLGFGVHNFGIAAPDVELLLRLMQSNSQVEILIHGPPGTGKSQFARSLALAASCSPYSFGDDDDCRGNRGVSRLIIARKLAANPNSVLVVDEAEPFLHSHTRSPFAFFAGGLDTEDKAQINLIMDHGKGKTIWIVNHIDGFDASTLRRFNYVLEMPNPNQKQRLTFWEFHGAQNQLVSTEWQTVWSEFSSRYELSPAMIANALNTAKTTCGLSDPSRVRQELHQIVRAHVGVGNGKELPPRRDSKWTIDVLNAVPSAESVLGGCRTWQDLPAADRPGQRMLFYGLPGTGKTEFARQLSGLLDFEIDIKQASDILSPYVGMAERNVRAAFRQAEQEGHILLMDEIDSYLYPRDKAQHSWETSLVNEFLTCLENFRGIFVGTTNNLGRLDPAVLRRFHKKVEFGWLKPEGCGQLAALLFPAVQGLAAHEWSKLPSLAPGDFAAVADRSDPPKNKDELLQALKAEAAVRAPEARKVGFN